MTSFRGLAVLALLSGLGMAAAERPAGAQPAPSETGEAAGADVVTPEGGEAGPAGGAERRRVPLGDGSEVTVVRPTPLPADGERPAAGGDPAEAENPLFDLRGEEVVDREVVTEDGAVVGRVADLVLDPTADAVQAVLRPSGFPVPVGGEVAVPLADMAPDAGGEAIVLRGRTAGGLEGLPAFEPGAATPLDRTARIGDRVVDEGAGAPSPAAGDEPAPVE